MKRIIILIVLTFSFYTGEGNLPPLAQAECRIKFTISNAGIAVTGTMEAGNVEIQFNPGDLSRSKIKAIALPATIQTGIGIRDKHLKRNDYFDVDHFSEIHIASKSFRKIRKHTYQGVFDLTIKNIMRTVTINFIRYAESNAAKYTANFEINRLDFNLGETSSILSEKVVIQVDIEQEF